MANLDRESLERLRKEIERDAERSQLHLRREAIRETALNERATWRYIVGIALVCLVLLAYALWTWWGGVGWPFYIQAGGMGR